MALVLGLTACKKETAKESYYVPNEVVLQHASLDVSSWAVTLGAIYNGEDAGIKSAEFLVIDAASGEKRSYEALTTDGVATATITNLEKGHDYLYNFVLTTPGDNKITATEDGYFSLSAPYDFVFSTQTTASAKILIISFKGTTALVRSMKLVLKDSSGNLVENVPEIVAHEGGVKALFKLDEWPQDLYSCNLDIDLLDGTTVSSPVEKFSTLPLPEVLTLLPVEMDEAGNWTLTASYDGDDKTVESGVITVFNKEGAELFTLNATCSGQKAVGKATGQDYGRYSWSCTLNLVDGSQLSAGPQGFIYAKPRAFETLDAPYDALVSAGISTEDKEGPFNFSYGGYDWEVSYLRAKTSSGYLVNGSSRKGYLLNVTPFPKGIKTVFLNLTQSDRVASNYEFYAKKAATDEWQEVSFEQPENKVFKCDLSDGDWHYFKFQSKGLKEIRLSGFSVDYFTEDIIEY